MFKVHEKYFAVHLANGAYEMTPHLLFIRLISNFPLNHKVDKGIFRRWGFRFFRTNG